MDIYSYGILICSFLVLSLSGFEYQCNVGFMKEVEWFFSSIFWKLFLYNRSYFFFKFLVEFANEIIWVRSSEHSLYYPFNVCKYWQPSFVSDIRIVHSLFFVSAFVLVSIARILIKSSFQMTSLWDYLFF